MHEYERMSQIRTLSEAAVYRDPLGPQQRAVMGLSPDCKRLRGADPFIVVPEEQSVLIAFELLVRVSQTRIKAPDAEYRRFLFWSYSTAITGPGCAARQWLIDPVTKSQIFTVRSAAAENKVVSWTLRSSTELECPSTMWVQCRGTLARSWKERAGD